MNIAVEDNTWRLAVDVGGTFIDLALLNTRTGEVIVEKQPSNPETLVDEFMAGLERLPVDLDQIELVVHGTTQGLNSLVQESGVETALLTTKGTRDVLLIGRAARVNMYDPHYSQKHPLIPRARIAEIAERVDAVGNIVRPLDLPEVEEAAARFVHEGVQAFAICFLHSYRFPEHEQRAAERIRELFPTVTVTCSSDLSREWREYERSSTAVSNAFIQPGFEFYVTALQKRLCEAGYSRDIVFVQSNGGTMPADVAACQPVRTLNSGPAGGVMGARQVALAHGIDNAITTDVGGTTYDVGLIVKGRVQERSVTTLQGRPIVAPSSDIMSVGAGGGSIAQIDTLTGGLRVGPESAGAVPGPVCFGRGGRVPTVTDCQLVLGWLDPTDYLSSRMVLDVATARQAIGDSIASPAGLTLEEAADGVLEVAEANMANAIRQITTQRGLDPMEFAVIAYGGGGGLFATNVADNLGVTRVIIPPHAAAFSAWGMLSSGFQEDRVLTRLSAVTVDTAAGILTDLKDLESEARAQMERYGLRSQSLFVQREVGVRYLGQSHSLNVPIDEEWMSDAYRFTEEVHSRFHALHLQRYGHSNPAMELEVVLARVRSGIRKEMPIPETKEPSAVHGSATREIFFRGTGWVSTAIWRREELAVGATVGGPAVVNDLASTILVPLEWTITRNPNDALVLEKEALC